MKRFFKPKDAAVVQVDAGLGPNKAGVTPFPVDLGREQVQREREREREREWERKRRQREQQMQQQQLAEEQESWSISKPNGVGPRTPPTNSILSPTPEAYQPPQPTFYLPPGASPPSPQLGSTPPPSHRPIAKQQSIPNLNLAHSNTNDNSNNNGRPNSQLQFPTPVPRYASPKSPATALPNPHTSLPQSQYQPPPPQPQYAMQQSQSHRPSMEMGGRPKDRDKEGGGGGKKEKKFFGIDWGSSGKDKEARKEMKERRDRESDDSHSHSQSHSQSQGHWQQQQQQQQYSLPPPQGYAQQPYPQQPQHTYPQQQQYQPQQPPQQQHPTYRDPTLAVRAAGDVGTAIRDICAVAPVSNIPAIIDLCERVNHSDSPDSVVKDAARAIRKEFKHGNEAEKIAAARVWLWMMSNCGGRGFRTHASNKKFMASLEPILTAPIGKPVVSGRTQQTLTEILAGLVYQYGAEKGCEGLRDLWLKVKLPQDNDMGYFLPPDHWIFDSSHAPAQRPHRNSDPPPHTALQQLAAQAQVSDGPGIYPGPPPPPRAPKATPPFGGPTYAKLVDPKEDLRKLVEECTAAKESARVLSEALVYTKPEQLNEKDVIHEFHAKCVRAQMSMMDQMAWASSLADKSKSRRERDSPTDEEKAFASLIDANEQLAEALRLHEEMEKLARDEREMQAAEERSRRDMRVDRSQAARMLADGSLAPPVMASGGASRSPSPRPRPLSDIAQRPETPSSEGHPPLPPPRPLPDNPRSASPRTAGPRPLPNPFKGVAAPSRGDSGADSSEESASLAPAKPSSKALGKRRAPPEDDAPKFDTDDLFRDQSQEQAPPQTPIDAEPSKPIVYAYDAYEDYQKDRLRKEAERQRQASRPVTRGPGGGSSMIAEEPAAVPPVPTSGVPTSGVANITLADLVGHPRTSSPTPMLPPSDHSSDYAPDDGVRRRTSILRRWRK